MSMPAATKPAGFLRRHWRGDYSLGRACWLHNFLVAMFAPAVSLLIAPALNDVPARYSSGSVLALTALGITAWVWGARGTWASATLHRVRGGKEGWAIAAKVLLMLGALHTVGELLGSAPSLEEHMKVAAGSQLQPAYRIEISADGRAVMLTGGMNDGAAAALAATLADAPDVETVVLASDGGWVREGRLTAELIHQRGLATYVEDECTSACTLAFLGGRDRTIGPNARLGFHQFRPIGESTSRGEAMTLLHKTYGAAGLERGFISRVADTRFDTVWYPTTEELVAAHVVTRQGSGVRTASHRP